MCQSNLYYWIVLDMPFDFLVFYPDTQFNPLNEQNPVFHLISVLLELTYQTIFCLSLDPPRHLRQLPGDFNNNPNTSRPFLF